MAPSQFRAYLCRVLPVAALVAICMVASTIAATLAILGSGSAVLEASVSSRVPVDYSADQVALKIPRLSPEIIDAVRRDRDASASDSAATLIRTPLYSSFRLVPEQMYHFRRGNIH